MVFNWILDKIAGDYNQRQINKMLPIVAKINEYYESWKDLTDEQIKNKTTEFKDRINSGEKLDDILPEAFATVKLACSRLVGQEFEINGQKTVWNMVPYDVQLLGGLVLHRGKISEMKTGEGKTLVATLPAYLNSLDGKGVHVVTVNDYLASRDALWMGVLYNWLGVSVGYVTKKVHVEARREQYEKDITYVENSELGFDFLRDNLAKDIDRRSMIFREMNYAIIDEVDSILIDEARTPLIISQPSESPTEKYEYYSKIANSLVACKGKKKKHKGLLKELLEDDKKEDEIEDGDYYIDEKNKTITLSSIGIEKLEKLLGVENLYKDIGYDEIHHIENAIKSRAVYLKDKDYIVNNGEVLIVDEHTGRVTPGRRFSEGLHQAIEAKENVTIQRESKTLASITYQNFFKQYAKLAGMTGTGVTEGEEFEKIYKLEVLAIPTNKPIIRVDKYDSVYFNQEAKWNAVSENIKLYHGMGLPILIGTSSIYTSEFVSGLLNKMNVPHYVLNAKFHQQEAQIVANAGNFKSVVVATNMAGRGTDIKLEDGLNDKIADNYVERIYKKLQGSTYSSENPKNVFVKMFSEIELDIFLGAVSRYFGSDFDLNGTDINLKLNDELEFIINKKDLSLHFKSNKVSSGEQITINAHFGLYILGTEKHDSRRIDNQLRGRAGRQGDPGMTQFFVALDDEIMRKIGGDKIQSIASTLLPKEELETMELTMSQFTSSIERAQKQMEGWHFGIRKHLFEYDTVINKQRIKIYKKRDEILFSNLDESIKYDVIDEVKTFIDDIVDNFVGIYTSFHNWNYMELSESIAQISGFVVSESELQRFNNQNELSNYIKELLKEKLDSILDNYDSEKIKDVFKKIYLDVIDKNWINHIDTMQYLREKVSLYGYAQMDPLIMYKKESYEKFTRLLFSVKEETVSYILKTDYSFLEDKQDNVIIVDENSEEEMLKKLQNVTKDLPDKYVKPEIEKENIKSDSDIKKYEEINLEGGKKGKLLEKTDDLEVIYIDESEDKKNGDNKLFQDNSFEQSKKKVRPNDPCICGSGKKYKKCCGKK